MLLFPFPKFEINLVWKSKQGTEMEASSLLILSSALFDISFSPQFRSQIQNLASWKKRGKTDSDSEYALGFWRGLVVGPKIQIWAH